MNEKLLRKPVEILTLCGVRFNLAAGWSDQPNYDGLAAVINAAIGWHINETDLDPYPLLYYRGTFRSKIAGVGTGLGISSIRVAMKFLTDNFGALDPKQYIQHVLDWEKQNGTEGGWQDQIGAIEGGFKLTVSENHRDFDIHRNDNHPIMDHIVLFDSGIRRPAKHIGDQVRILFNDRRFKAALAQNVEIAQRTFRGNAEELALGTFDCWQRLVSFVPEMEVNKLPLLPNCWGRVFTGAGGGGWGMYFMENPDSRQEAIGILNNRGYDAYIPVLLNGIKHIRVTAEDQV